MNIKDFCKLHNVNHSAVSNYIARHSALFVGHIKKNGNEKQLDKVAVAILEKQYQNKGEKVEVLPLGDELSYRNELKDALRRVYELQELNMELVAYKGKYEAQKLMIDYQDTCIKDQREELKEKNNQINLLNQRVDQEQFKASREFNKAQRLEEELNRFEKSILGFYRKK